MDGLIRFVNKPISWDAVIAVHVLGRKERLFVPLCATLLLFVCSLLLFSFLALPLLLLGGLLSGLLRGLLPRLPLLAALLAGGSPSLLALRAAAALRGDDVLGRHWGWILWIHRG